jgi:hypothetical protein
LQASGLSPRQAAVVHRKVSKVHPRLGSPSEEPKGGDTSIQDFGTEAGADDKLAAAQALTLYLHAYATRDGLTSCALLSSGAIAVIQRAVQAAPAKGGSDCPAALNRLTAGISRADGRQIENPRIVSLRLKGDRAFLIFDAGGAPFAIPMLRQGGEWKVAAVSGTPLG